MKIALAQFDMPLGDFPGICSRLRMFARLAVKQDVDLLCVPAPLFTGVVPGLLVDNENFQHDLLLALEDLSGFLSDGLEMLVPAIVPMGDAHFFEVFHLVHGHVVPLRSVLVKRREGSSLALWNPPVISVNGSRLAITFDAARDMDSIPAGCDLVVSFQVDGFDVTDPETAGISGIADARYRRLAEDHGIWIAHLMPVGGFDEACYPGGSFVLDDSGRVVAAAPLFEDSLLVQEIVRGMSLPSVADHELPVYNREELLWGSLRLHLRDAVAARGVSRVLVRLEDDLPSALLALLAVDALGPRNVLGLLIERDDAVTPQEAARAQARLDAIRTLAARLNIRLIERAVEADRPLQDDAGAAGAPASRFRDLSSSLCVEDTANALSAAVIASLTKTDYAFAIGLDPAHPGLLAPFGDIYLSELEHLAKYRNGLSTVLPEHLLGLSSVERALDVIVERAGYNAYPDAPYAERIVTLIRRLGAPMVDAVLEAVVDRNLSLEDCPLYDREPEAIALIGLLVRKGESRRRRLPAVPVASARAFAEGAWPEQLAWLDLGRNGADLLSVEALAKQELERLEVEGTDQLDRMRLEVMGLLGSIFGLSPEQLKELSSDGVASQIRFTADDAEAQMRNLMEEASALYIDGSPFFSKN